MVSGHENALCRFNVTAVLFCKRTSVVSPGLPAPPFSPPAPFHQSSVATPVVPLHWSRPGRPWSALSHLGWTSSLSTSWRMGQRKYVFLPHDNLQFLLRAAAFLSFTWCTPPCFLPWRARSLRPLSAHERKPSQGSPCPVQKTAPLHIPPGCSLCTQTRRTNVLAALRTKTPRHGIGLRLSTA